MASAASRAFGVSELLEMILMETQRVNKTWLHTISKSTKIQRKLCFEPGSRIPVKFFHDTADETSDKMSKGQFPLQCWKRSINETEECRVRLNPLVIKVYEALRQMNSGGTALRQLPAAWQMPTASWRRMLLTQSAVEAQFAVLSMLNTWELHGTRLINTNDVRLGDIVDWVDAEYAAVEHTFGKSARKAIRILGEHMWQEPGGAWIGGA